MNAVGRNNLPRPHTPRDAMTCHRTILTALLLALTLPPGRADEVDDVLAAIGKVKLTGEGSADARAAAERLGQRGPEVLPRLLAAMDGASVVAANWYRTAYERIV